MHSSVRQRTKLAALTLSVLLGTGVNLCAQNAAATAAPDPPGAAGRHTFITRCASCHGTTGNGGEFGPSIINRVPLRSDDELKALLREGVASAGMPGFPGVVDQDRANLIR